MAELMFGMGMTKKKKADNAYVKETKDALKNVNITESVEAQVRKEQHKMEKDWKEAGKKQIEENKNFDMARALFN
ncbi:unnamed protein product [Cylindrotheca closterium]|uniref:Uncharacterized protein n=1 Tax=Cylindrotheca closterium TaxID=2856 RepID=A0AAD2FMD8_9STRA|nr:unnamed protein product [Cylindrotheca closterium]